MPIPSYLAFIPVLKEVKHYGDYFIGLIYSSKNKYIMYIIVVSLQPKPC